jgi:hypothetical protein
MEERLSEAATGATISSVGIVHIRRSTLASPDAARLIRLTTLCRDGQRSEADGLGTFRKASEFVQRRL